MRLSYNNLNLPDSAYFMLRGNTLKMEYMADGRRVRTTAKTYGTPLLIPVGGTPMPQEPASVTEEVRDGELVFRDGRLVEVRTDGGWFSMWNDTLSTTQVRSYFYVTDYLGSVRLTVDCNGRTSGTANARQGMEYLPSGAIFRSTDYDMQTRRFCGKELITMHGWNMYDSQARFQYSLLPRFSTMDPLAEKYYSLSPYNYAGNDWINYTDNKGDSISVAEEYRTSFLSDINSIFGEKTSYFSFNENGNFILNNKSEFIRGLSKEQKGLFKGLYKAMTDKVTTSIEYEEEANVFYQGLVSHKNTLKDGGGAFTTIDKSKIVISPNVGAITVVLDIPTIVDGRIKATEDVFQTTTTALFHEISERNTSRHDMKRGSVIDYENQARRILDLPIRPYDINHTYRNLNTFAR